MNYKDIFSDIKNNISKSLKSPLFTFFHSANFNSARTAALQDVTVKDNDFAKDCFREDC